MSKDYRDTVQLPRTDFPLKAGLPTLEPKILERWRDISLYRLLREQAKGKDKFILHDGPPYANGHLHIGHALNKILKDVINRCQQMLGKNANYVPGWDCHGLPIEWKIEEKYRDAGKDKDSVPIVKFRRECREFADHWIKVQGDEFMRLGVVGDWDKPYTTMSFDAEAEIVRELGKFVINGLLYRGSKPVMWSVVEKTALAEAEVEYDDFVSDQVWVKFGINHVAGHGTALELGNLQNACVVIWTTTPWTLPGNRAICYSPKIKYGLYEVTDAPEGNWTKAGETLIVADALAGAVFENARVIGHKRLGDVDPKTIVTCTHPLREVMPGYAFDVPMFPGEHVADDTGSGFVHTAPGHGREDFEIWTANKAWLEKSGIDPAIPYTVDGDGFFTDEAPGFTGKRVITDKGKKGDANEAVIGALKKAGALMARARLTHQYPHSWRSKKPVIFRNTPQWFIAMDKDIRDASGKAKRGDTLRARAIAAIKATRWVPRQGEARINGMIENRPDWVISRQRAWGVPIAVFVDLKTGEPLRDQAVLDRVADAVAREGADTWFTSDSSLFLGNDHDPGDYEKVTDILDVWFESGATHAFVLEPRRDLAWPASLYLEGSDQHRGWFHSSLLESCGTRGRAPYQAVLTHGFVMAEDGQKMSKSLGNVVSPQEVIATHGADILRLWVVGSDYSEDLRIGPEILKSQTDIYRRLRNTLRYLLGNLNGFQASERVRPAEMPELERWVLHRLSELDRLLRQACDDYQFHPFFAELHNFCAVDLSAFYFDVRKDSLYCDRPDSPRRRAARTVLDHLFDCLTAWLAPFVCFTAEEAWLARHPTHLPRDGKAEASVHLRQFPIVPAAWRDDALGAKWKTLRDVRRVVTGALEIERAAKRIGSSLEAAPVVHTDRQHQKLFDGLDAAELFITSAVTFSDAPPPAGAFRLAEVAGVAVQPAKAAGAKCARCWRVLPEVGDDPEYPGTCGRCADAVRHRPAAG
ncbi:MAG: isoleucine--tRNA ligase [Rhodospirillales bacterium]|nr:isoleucine--tRNA ligase [Rhodospirillales bacterium]